MLDKHESVRGVGPTELAAAVQIGAMLKIVSQRMEVYGVVSALRITDPTPQATAGEQRIVDIELLGEAVTSRERNGGIIFQRGVSVYPALGDHIFTSTAEELRRIYARPSASNIRVGALYQDSKLPAYVLTDELLGKHFAILGTTGSGKSCATTLILKSILAEYPHGHIVLLEKLIPLSQVPLA